MAGMVLTASYASVCSVMAGNPIMFFAQAVITAVLTILVGQRVSFYWHLRQKRKELALMTGERFWYCYGEFYVIWKLWNYGFPPKKDSNGEIIPGETEVPSQELKRELMTRITDSEREMEGILLKLLCEREMDDREVETVAKFRQVFQQMRSHIRDHEKLDWTNPHDKRYVALKTLSAGVYFLITTIDRTRRPGLAAAQLQLSQATAQKWEQLWTEPVA